jgi:16S rRNA processing protein RimM
MAEDGSPSDATQQAADAAERWVAVARLTRPHGVRGEMRIAMFNPDSRLLLERPRSRLCDAEGVHQPQQRLEGVRPGPHYVIGRIRGVQQREQAEALRGWLLEVPRTALGEAEDDEYFFCDLEGCEVLLAGQAIGRVRRVADYPTCDALVVQRHGATDIEVPLHADYVATIDVAGGRIELTTLEGLQ